MTEQTEDGISVESLGMDGWVRVIGKIDDIFVEENLSIETVLTICASMFRLAIDSTMLSEKDAKRIFNQIISEPKQSIQ